MNQGNQSPIKSPLTRSDNVRLIRHIECRQLRALWRKVFVDDVDKVLSEFKEVGLYECLETGLQFFAPPEAAGDGSFYARLAKFDWYYPATRWDLDEGLKLARHARNLLEIGCGDGAFLKRWRQAACADAFCRGVELNEEAASHAVSFGLQVTTQPLDQLAIETPDHYDVVCAFQVLEHLSDPSTFLKSAAELLQQGGSLILAVPNRECSLGLEQNPLDSPPHHMSRWSAETFKNIERFFPLRLENVYVQPLMHDEFDRFLSAASSKSPAVRFLMKISGMRRLARFFLSVGLANCFTGQSIIAHYRKIQ